MTWWLQEAFRTAQHRDPIDVLNDACWLERQMWERLANYVSTEQDSSAANLSSAERQMLEFASSGWVKELVRKAEDLNPAEALIAAHLLVDAQHRVVERLFEARP